MKTKILFVGNFLSKKKGTKGIAEKLAENFQSSRLLHLVLISKFNNKFLRLADIISHCLFLNYQKAQIDVFSDQAFLITRISSFFIKLRRKPIIMNFRGGKLPEFYQLNEDVFRRTVKRADLILSPSMYLKSFFGSKGFQIQYLPNSINLELFSYNRSSIIPSSLLWVRAFNNIYNPDLAVKTLAEVKKKFPDVTLTMIGPDKGNLKETLQLAEDLDVKDQINYLGPIPNNQLYQYYQSHAIFLNTTSYESFGVAVLEAAACGIPIVSTAVGEIPYLWSHGEDILLSDKIDTISFSSQVAALLQNNELALSLSKNARKKAENFSWEKIKTEWEQILNQDLL